MTPLAVLTGWSYAFPLIITLTIWLNSKGNPYGWLLGFLAQVGQIVISRLFEQVQGFSLSVLPAIMFLVVFVQVMRARAKTGAAT